MLSVLFNRNNLRERELKRGTPDYFWFWVKSYVSEFKNYLDTAQPDITVVHQLTKQLQEYHELLIGELNKGDDGKYELIVSADGHEEGVEAVQNLVSVSPQISGWEIVAFKPPIDLKNKILNVDDLSYPESNVLVKPVLVENNRLIDLKIYIRGMDGNEEKCHQLAFLYLNLAIGEYNTIKRLRFVEFHSRIDENASEDAMNLNELQNWILQKFN